MQELGYIFYDLSGRDSRNGCLTVAMVILLGMFPNMRPGYFVYKK